MKEIKDMTNVEIRDLMWAIKDYCIERVCNDCVFSLGDGLCAFVQRKADHTNWRLNITSLMGGV